MFLQNSVDFQGTTRRYVPEGSTRNSNNNNNNNNNKIILATQQPKGQC
jgi:hypothetical protein